MSGDSPGADLSGFADLHFDWGPETVSAISEALAEPGEEHELSARVKAALPEDAEYHYRAVVLALDYHARRPSDRNVAADDLYGPMFTAGDGYAYPDPLSAASPETVNAWSDAARLFTANDVVTARLNDLLWCRKVGPRPDKLARDAHTAFRRVWAKAETDGLHRSEALVRALDIAKQLSDTVLIDETVLEMVIAVRETLADAEWVPGVAIPMIEALMSLRESSQPDELDTLIDEALERYVEDPFIVEALQLFRMQRAKDPDTRRIVVAETVNMWRQQADTQDGLIGLSHLERALELASNEGLSTLAGELRALLQQPRTSESLGMKKVAVEGKVPRDEAERFLALFVDTPGAEQSLERLGAYSPFSDVDKDAGLVEEQMRQYPLSHLFSTVITNDEGIPLAHIVSDQQKFDHALMRHHTMGITIWTQFLTQILQRLVEEGRVAPADVEKYSRGEFIDEASAAAMGKSFEAFARGDYDASFQRLIGRVERVVRAMARTIGVSVYREPSLDGSSLGAYKGLGELLRLLEGRVPERDRRYFAVLLTERTGINLRNRWAHGLMEEATAGEAALVLHVMFVLAGWSTTPPTTEPMSAT